MGSQGQTVVYFEGRHDVLQGDLLKDRTVAQVIQFPAA